jgi:xanthine dehydrogenase accessory factor
MARLRAAGLDEDELNRLSSPIGLDLGDSTPEETAVSIAGEIIAASSGGSARPLRFLSSPIHKANVTVSISA